VPSPTNKFGSSVNQQIKAALHAVREFLAGRAGDAEVSASESEATRAAVAAELLATMSGQAITDDTTTDDTTDVTANTAESAGPVHLQNSSAKKQERARKLFVAHGYFDELVESLRAAGIAEERAAAARSLGLVGSQRGTAHLVAAMFDDDAEVRGAAEAALAQIEEQTKTQAQASPPDAPAAGTESSRLGLGRLHWEGEPDRREVHIAPAIELAGNASEVVSPDAAGEPDARLTTRQQPGPLDQSMPTEIATATSVEEELLRNENEIRKAIAELTQKLETLSVARVEADAELNRRIECEAQLRSEAAARRAEEEKLRQQVFAAGAQRRAEEQQAIAQEEAARAHAELTAQKLGQEEIELLVKAAELRVTAEALVRQRVASVSARQESAEAEQLAAAKRARDDAQLRHEAEQERLSNEAGVLRACTAEIEQRTAEVAAARERADAERERLLAAQARMKAADEARAQAEAERTQLEADINQRREAGLQLLEETRRRGEEVQARLEEETRRRAEAEERRQAELEKMRTSAAAASRQLAEREQEILGELNSLRIADAEARKRIEDAEVRRRGAEETYRLAAEKVQRVEAEAHARVKEEEQMLAKLEIERRTVAVEAQSRAEQEKRIREELEMFRRLELEERPKLKAAIAERTEAEARLQELREQLKAEDETRSQIEAEVASLDQERVARSRVAEPEPPAANQSISTTDRPSAAPTDKIAESEFSPASAVKADAEVEVTPTVVAYLSSADPYKRAAAFAELARSRSADAFSLITRGFDDQSPQVRNAAARAFRTLEPHRTVDLFNRALEEASAERRQNIGGAIAASGLATEAIDDLVSENREDTYNALSILFVMAKAGEIDPLIKAIEGHENVQVRMAAIKLLTLNGQSDIANAAAKRRLDPS
jgi:hypothetical protein